MSGAVLWLGVLRTPRSHNAFSVQSAVAVQSSLPSNQAEVEESERSRALPFRRWKSYAVSSALCYRMC